MSQNYNGYFITSCERVWSYKSNRFLSLYEDAKGYKNVKINNQKKFVHRLVAAISINKARSGISNCLYGIANTCGDYHWELI